MNSHLYYYIHINFLFLENFADELLAENYISQRARARARIYI